MTNRRDFLKALAAALGATASVQVAIAMPNPGPASRFVYSDGTQPGTIVYRSFNPAREHGRQIYIPGRPDEKLVQKTVDLLLEDARRFLPPGTPFIVLDGGSFDWGHLQAFAWYYSPGVARGDFDDPEHTKMAIGAKIIARAMA